MKTFIELRINDEYYSCTPESTEFKVHKITNISTVKLDTEVRVNSDIVSIVGEHLYKSSYRKDGYYNQSVIIFSDKSQAVRYSKAQAFKEFNKLKEDAYKAIQLVKDFRLKYYDQFNKDWTDEEINKLEKIKKECL